MYTTTLKPGYEIVLAAYNGKIRIIIMHDNEEYVCRIETLKKLKEFAAVNEAKIFKGRLKLYKENGLIHVIAKGEALGSVDEERFKRSLDKSGC
jgi:hypothetical protein